MVHDILFDASSSRDRRDENSSSKPRKSPNAGFEEEDCRRDASTANPADSVSAETPTTSEEVDEDLKV